VLVTGSNRGIGLEFVRQYAAEGARVVATCREPADAHELHAVDGEVEVARLDIASEADLDALVARLDDAPIDLLVLNAAIKGGPHARFGDVDWAVWQRVLDVNLFGTLRVAMALWPNVAASFQKRIAVLTSRAGTARNVKAGRSYAYGTSKAALNLATRQLGLDLAEHGITVGLLNPGHVRTGIGGANAPMEPADSVRRMRAVIETLTPERTGRFWHLDGTEIVT